MPKYTNPPATGTGARVSGIIKKIVPEKGFGFIAGDGGVEYFFHRSAVRNVNWDQVEVSQKVSFLVQANPKGPRAEDVDIEVEL